MASRSCTWRGSASGDHLVSLSPAVSIAKKYLVLRRSGGSLCARPGWHNGLWRGRCGSGCSKAQGLLTDPFLLDRTLWRAQNLGEAGRQVGPSSRHSRPAANEHVPGQLLRVPPTHQ